MENKDKDKTTEFLIPASQAFNIATRPAKSQEEMCNLRRTQLLKDISLKIQEAARRHETDTTFRLPHIEDRKWITWQLEALRYRVSYVTIKCSDHCLHIFWERFNPLSENSY